MLVYTAGPYKAIKSAKGIDYISKAFNINTARDTAAYLWNCGFTVICPHLNTLDFEYLTDIPNKEFVDRDLEIVERMDALIMLPNWELSKGAVREKEHAESLNIPIYIWPTIPEEIT